MTSKSLRAVSPDERAPRPVPETVTAAVESGSMLDQYRAIRARIAKAIDADDIRGADLAALSRRLHELSKEIATLEAKESQEAGGGHGEVADGKFDPKAV